MPPRRAFQFSLIIQFSGAKGNRIFSLSFLGAIANAVALFLYQKRWKFSISFPRGQRTERHPYDTSLLGIVSGEDLCTLVTCTPYGVNTHRLLVRGSRIPFEEAAALAEEITEQAPHSTWEQKYLQGILWGVIAALGLGLVIFSAVYIYRKFVSGGGMYVQK